MSNQVCFNKIVGPQGEFHVSTVRLAAGGAPDEPSWSPFALSDYKDENPWPFETLVFGSTGHKGLYHQAYVTEEEAKLGHAEVVELCRNGKLELGKGVHGPFGTPTLTVEQWKQQIL
jgi:hypothetical protein